MSDRSHATTTERGQLVLVAAVFIAVACVPITVAYLQLGYDADIESSGDGADESLRSTTRLLQRAAHDATTNNTTAWAHRNDTVTAIRNRLEPHVSAIETERITAGTVQRVRYNESAATEWATSNCPNGSARRFGSCTADRGVVVQERAGETHVLAVAFDVTLTTDRKRVEATVLVRPIDRLTNRSRESFHQTPTDRRRTARTATTPPEKPDRTTAKSLRTGATDERRSR